MHDPNRGCVFQLGLEKGRPSTRLVITGVSPGAIDTGSC